MKVRVVVVSAVAEVTKIPKICFSEGLKKG
jgi:hypothetical protein